MNQWDEILAARMKAHRKHSVNSIEAIAPEDPRWLTILVEEIGEVANALTYDGPHGKLPSELLDVLAVASAWLDSTRSMSIGSGIREHERQPADCPYLKAGWCYWCCDECDRGEHTCPGCGMPLDHQGLLNGKEHSCT